MVESPSIVMSSGSNRLALHSLITGPLVALAGINALFDILFLLLCKEVHERATRHIDQSMLRAIDRHTNGTSLAVARAASFAGAGAVVAAIGVLLAIAFLFRCRWLDGLFVAGTVGGYGALTALVKNLMQQRPVAFFRIPEGHFPSGHTVGTTCLAFALGYFLWRGRRRTRTKVLGTVALVGAIALVGGSRLALGVHYPTDVLGGVLLGTAWMSALTIVCHGTVRWQRLHGREAGGDTLRAGRTPPDM